MTQKIAILGSTGSIGVQALEVARQNNISIVGLTANRNIELLEKQIREFNPLAVSVADDVLAQKLQSRIKDTKTQVYYGTEGLRTISTLSDAEMVLNSIVGIAGLIPTMDAISKGKNIALANKETLVAGGSFVMEAAKRKNVVIMPVDSEHSAIYQCLNGNRAEDVENIILTASGGPFRGMSEKELANVTINDALNHPTWSMGKKITIDSATLANKGLEVIEARWLFNVSPDNIKVVIHPQSIIHSMVEYKDGSVIAQMGAPDMRIPIQYALMHPLRPQSQLNKLDILSCGPLTFEEPDLKVFPCLQLAYDALRTGGTMPALFNGANEAVVELFLEGKIGFMDIPRILENVMAGYAPLKTDSLDNILETDKQARIKVLEMVEQQYYS